MRKMVLSYDSRAQRRSANEDAELYGAAVNCLVNGSQGSLGGQPPLRKGGRIRRAHLLSSCTFQQLPCMTTRKPGSCSPKLCG